LASGVIGHGEDDCENFKKIGSLEQCLKFGNQPNAEGSRQLCEDQRNLILTEGRKTELYPIDLKSRN
jgi:hypothetical protein